MKLWHLLCVLVLVILLARPPAPEDTYFHGGSVEDAVLVLAEASVNESSKMGSRAIDDEYSHWSSPVNDGTAVSAATVAGISTADKDSPVVAGIVGIASVTGLRELASIVLYLLSDYGEAQEDYELVDICLRAIPYVDPHFVDAYIIRAYFYSLTDPQQAESILLRGLRWNPNDWELYHDLAWLYLRNTTVRKPQPRTALRYLKAGILVKHPYSLRRLYGYLLAHLGQFDEAEKVFLEMIDEKNIPASDLKKAGVGLESVQKRQDRLASTILSKLIKVGKQETDVPVCQDCGHHHTGGHDHDHDLDHDHDDPSTGTGSMFDDLKDGNGSEDAKTTPEKKGHVHGPWCNH